MISYEPLWKTMKQKEITKYALINHYNMSSQTINALRHNEGISIYTLERLCEILECTPNDVVEFIEEQKSGKQSGKQGICGR